MQLQQHFPPSLIRSSSRKVRSTGDLVGLDGEFSPMRVPRGMAEVRHLFLKSNYIKMSNLEKSYFSRIR